MVIGWFVVIQRNRKEMQKRVKSLVVHIVALVVFGLVSVVMFYPELGGDVMQQGDIANFEGTTKDLYDHIEQYGEHPGWLGRMFGGMPAHLSSMDEGLRVSGVFRFHSTSSIVMMFFAMSGFYLMLLLMGVSPYVAVAGALGYGLSTYFPIIISAGHITKMWALQWVAPLVGSVWYSYSRNMWLGGALTAFFTAMIVAAGHHQITYYFLFVILSAVVCRGVMSYRERLLRQFARVSSVLLLAGVLGVGSNIVPLYYVSDYSTYSTRGDGGEWGRAELASKEIDTKGGLDRDYINAWSYGKSESFNLFIPNFMGGGRNFRDGGAVQAEFSNYNVPADTYKSVSSYHGSQPFTEGPVYIGAVLIFLAVFALFLLPGTYKWWIVVPSLLALMLSWGGNFSVFTDLFIDYVPLYNKFRVPSMILVVLEWSVPLLASLGLCKLYKMRDGLPITYTPKYSLEDSLKISLYITGGFALFSAVILPSFMDFSAVGDARMQLPQEIVSAMESERASLLRMDSLRSLLFVLLTAGVLWFYIKGRIKNVVVYGTAVALLVVVDLFGVDRRYVSAEDFHPKSRVTSVRMTDADRQILQDTQNYRVADFWRGNPFAANQTTYFHRSIGGYHPAKVGRYQDLIEQHLSRMTLSVYDMLNVRYFIDQNGQVQYNPDAIGNAVVVDSVIWAENPTEELELLGSDGFNPSTTAVVDVRWRGDIIDFVRFGNSQSADSVTLEHYELGREQYRAQLTEPRLVVFSEVFYKDWTVSINGTAATPLQVDYLLRGVVVPAGGSTIEWRFTLPHQSTLMTIAASTTTIILLWLFTALILLILNNTRNEKKGL